MNPNSKRLAGMCSDNQTLTARRVDGVPQLGVLPLAQLVLLGAGGRLGGLDLWTSNTGNTGSQHHRATAGNCGTPAAADLRAGLLAPRGGGSLLRGPDGVKFKATAAAPPGGCALHPTESISH